MAESLFSAMTRDLHKSKSLILAGRSTLDSSQGQPSLAGGGLDTGSVGGDKDVLSAEQEFEELSRWCHMPGQVASSLEATSAQETEPAIESVPLTKNESEAIQMGSVEVAPILIKSVGVVKQRYRQLQRDGEIEEARKASRLKRNFAEQKKPRRVAATEAEPAEPVVLPIVPHGLRIDNLCYAKFCTDFEYKRDIINAIKSGQRDKQSILLRTVAVETEDHRRDGRQVLRQLFMQTLRPSDLSCIPPVEEVAGALQMLL